jgi:hypothetical protein
MDGVKIAVLGPDVLAVMTLDASSVKKAGILTKRPNSASSAHRHSLVASVAFATMILTRFLSAQNVRIRPITR